MREFEVHTSLLPLNVPLVGLLGPSAGFLQLGWSIF